jgi:hypothetical protein
VAKASKERREGRTADETSPSKAASPWGLASSIIEDGAQQCGTAMWLTKTGKARRKCIAFPKIRRDCSKKLRQLHQTDKGAAPKRQKKLTATKKLRQHTWKSC